MRQLLAGALTTHLKPNSTIIVPVKENTPIKGYFRVVVDIVERSVTTCFLFGVMFVFVTFAVINNI